MDEESLNLIFGVIFLILIINTTILWSIVSSINGQNSTPKIISAGSVPDPISPGLPKPVPSPIPSLQPPRNRGAALADPKIIVTSSDPTVSAKSIASYISIEMPEMPEIEKYPLLQPSIPQRNFTGFVTVYALMNQEVSQALPRISMKLVKPPLVIDYNISPINITDEKYVEYKVIDTLYKEIITIDRSYEDSWFRVVVRDKDTGEIVEEDGFGRTYSLENQRQLVVRKSGNYSIEFKGEFATVDLTVRVRDDGIIP